MQFSPEELAVLARHEPNTAQLWSEPAGHVGVFAVLDHGAKPALGEVCLATSVDSAQALEQACRLARSASIRAGLLGLDRAGAAVVVVPDPELDLQVALELLSQRLSASPLRVVIGAGLRELAERSSPHISHDPEGLARLRAGVLEACTQPLLSLDAQCSALVLGCGPRGRDLAAALRHRGVELCVWDPDRALAQHVAEAVGARVLDTPWVDAAVDLLVPCTPEPLIDEIAAERLAASVVCGGAPRVFAAPQARATLEARGRRFVPEILCATAEPIALAVAEGLLDRDEALARVEQTAREVLDHPLGAQDRVVTLAVTRSKTARSRAS